VAARFPARPLSEPLRRRRRRLDEMLHRPAAAQWLVLRRRTHLREVHAVVHEELVDLVAFQAVWAVDVRQGNQSPDGVVFMPGERVTGSREAHREHAALDVVPAGECESARVIATTLAFAVLRARGEELDSLANESPRAHLLCLWAVRTKLPLALVQGASGRLPATPPTSVRAEGSHDVSCGLAYTGHLALSRRQRSRTSLPVSS